MSYPFKDIEPKWQRLWEEQKLFRAVNGDGAYDLPLLEHWYRNATPGTSQFN